MVTASVDGVVHRDLVCAGWACQADRPDARQAARTAVTCARAPSAGGAASAARGDRRSTCGSGPGTCTSCSFVPARGRAVSTSPGPTAPGGKAVAFAPFVLRAAVPGVNRVAIVVPTYTWQAYNFYDANGDGRPDSWYGDPRRHSVALGRPYLNSGKPPHYRTLQRGFLRFLVHTGKQADYLSDEDLESFASGDDLAKLYDLVIFSGHEEYVTTQIYDVVQRYRDLGGNLAFLSANNFFRHVVLSNGHLWRGRLWRDVGRPESALIGVQYNGNDRGGHVAPYVVTLPDAAPWLFNGVSVVSGSPLSTAKYGIEFDAITPFSPPGTVVLAEVTPGLRGTQIRGQMSYYETPVGAKVFAAGTLSFSGSDNPTGSVLFQNIWTHLVNP